MINTKGLDASFTGGAVVPVDWFRRRYAEGFRIYSQCLWTGGYAGNDGIRAVAPGNLRNALDGGMRITGYANASPPTWWPTDRCMREIRANAGAMWPELQVVKVDVEIPLTTFERTSELSDALLAEGKNQRIEVLYTARWFWVGHMGNAKDLRWRRWKVWNAYYDFNPDVDFGSAPYGPWTIDDLIGEQYQGTTRLDSVDVDLNVFDLEKLFPIVNPAPPPTPKEVDMPFLIHNAAGTYWEMCPGGFKKAIVYPALQAYAEAKIQGFPPVTDVKLPDTLINQIPDLPADLPAPVATVDAAAIAKAVNDELARRQKE